MDTGSTFNLYGTSEKMNKVGPNMITTKSLQPEKYVPFSNAEKGVAIW